MTKQLFLLTAALLTQAGRAQVFTMTDGSAESWGGTPNGDSLALNHFNTGGQAVVIDQINACWNPLSAAVTPTLVIYSDPNGDGNPSDAQLLLRYSLNIQPNLVILNQSLQSYAIPATTVSGSFFVGTFLSDRDSGFDPNMGIDTSHPQPGQSWILENSRGAGLMNLSYPVTTSSLVTPLNTYVNGNFMIEARYAPVPEPSTCGLVAAFVAGATALRRFRRMPARR